MMIKKAFTIAELLVAGLVLILVLAITPLVRLNYEKHELYEKFRTSMVTINLALNMSVVENGEINKWDFFDGDVEKILTTYFMPYIKDNVRIDCNSFKRIMVSSLDGTEYIKGCKIYGLSSAIPKGILKFDKATFGIYNIDKKNKIITVVLDTNGFKQPNIIGRDIFSLKINDSIYTPSIDAGIQNQNCSLDLLPKTGIIQGFGCADRLMNEGIMDY